MERRLEPYTEVGHLSTDAVEVERGLKLRFPNELDVSQRANKLAMRMLMQLPPEAGPPFDGMHMFLVGTFLCIVLRRCQGALLLAFRGLSFEADTLTRSALETAFILGSFLKDPRRVLVDLEKADIWSKRAMANAAVASNKVSSFLDAGQQSQLLELLNGPLQQDRAPLNVEAHAKWAGMERLYTVFYRGMSTAGAHLTATLLDGHQTWGDDVRQVEFGPDEDAARPVHNVLTVLVNVTRVVAARFQMVAISSEADALAEEFMKLTGAPST